MEDQLQACAHDLKYASVAIQNDLDRFQRQKVADIRDMAIALAMAHRDWCKKVKKHLIYHEYDTHDRRISKLGKRFRKRSRI